MRLKHCLLSSALAGTAALFVGAAPAGAAGLVITAVFDGPLTGGVPKGVELHAIENIPDLAEYGLGSANNGGGSDGQEFTFPAMSVAAGEYIYVASEQSGFNSFFGFAPDHVSGSAMAINGDDAIELFHNGAVIDLFGDPDTDGSGEAWDYQDGWAARRAGAAASAGFEPGQWQFSGPNALDGAFDNVSAASPVPLEQYTGDGDGDGGGNGDGGSGDAPPLRLISAIQGTPDTQGENRFGDTDVSPLIDQRVTVEAVVVGDFQNGDADGARELDGFFLQEEAADEDGDPRSSEGLFVYDAGFGVDVAPGDRVRVVGTVQQYFGETQLGDVTGVTVIGSGALSEVAPADIVLPFAEVTGSQDGFYQPDLEAWEGMLVRLPGTLTVTEQYQLDRFNEIKLVAGPRPYQFTQLRAPGAGMYQAHREELGARRITYDDGRNEQNVAIDNLDGFAPYGEATAVRMGDTVENLTGVLDYKWAGNAASGATWRVRAHRDGANTFQGLAEPRALQAPEVGGNLTLASLNVLNFFTTLDNGATTALGHEPRGADSAQELERQLAKTVAAIVELDADVLGLVEIENDFDDTNDGSTAVEVLVNAVNDALGEAAYDYIYPGQRFVGGDAIAVALIYRVATVQPAPGSEPALLDDSAAAALDEFAGRDFGADPIFNGEATNRVPLAASFEHLATGEQFTAVVNHFKSKGRSGLELESNPNYDQGDGAGFWNQRRTDAARALVAWLEIAPTRVADPDIAVMGDLNGYAMEDPVQYLLGKGFTNVQAAQAYSYVFDGQVGTLDYVLLSDALADRMSDAAIWHINADEADALDYNLDFGRDPAYYDGATPVRNSDHDPLLVGLSLSATAIPGDLDGDGVLGAGDRALLRQAFGQCAADGGYLAAADLDGDGCISMRDYRQWLTLFISQNRQNGARE